MQKPDRGDKGRDVDARQGKPRLEEQRRGGESSAKPDREVDGKDVGHQGQRQGYGCAAAARL